jgi:hypothetical protein
VYSICINGLSYCAKKCCQHTTVNGIQHFPTILLSLFYTFIFLFQIILLLLENIVVSKKQQILDNLILFVYTILTMIKNTPKEYQDNLIAIYTYVSTKEFKKAEIELLKIIEHVITNQAYKIPGVLHFISLMYTDFNSYYCKWLTKSGTRIKVQLSDLYTKEHSNYLIGNCTDPAAMDDLLYELIHCSDDEANSEVKIHYSCYIRRLHNKQE